MRSGPGIQFMTRRNVGKPEALARGVAPRVFDAISYAENRLGQLVRGFTEFARAFLVLSVLGTVGDDFAVLRLGQAEAAGQSQRVGWPDCTRQASQGRNEDVQPLTIVHKLSIVSQDCEQIGKL